MSAATDLLFGRHNLQLPDFPIKNTSGAPIPSGATVKLDSGNALSAANPFICVIPTVAVADLPFGVAVETIPTAGTGRVQTIDGTAVVCIALGAISAGAIVGPSTTSGQVTTYTAANPSLGQALSAATTAGDPILVKLAISKNA